MTTQQQTSVELSDVPTVRGDSSLALLTEGYRFGMHRFESFGSDVFRARLMLKPVTFIRGAGAAEFFYEGARFSRDRSLPKSVLHSLQDEGSVQTLEGADHHHRKGMFLSFMGASSMQHLDDIFAEVWAASVSAWSSASHVVLQDEMALVLTRTVCRWAGVELTDDESRPRAREFAAMISNAGTFGVPNWISRAGRLRTEAWAREAVEHARASGDDRGTVLSAIASHRSANGDLLPVHTAAIELLNVLRPMVAVGRFITFAAWALNRHPRWRDQFASGSDDDVVPFVQEVRRFSPFFPVVGGRATRALEWNGARIERDDWVMLDLFATNRHPDLWSNPEEFLPERFRGVQPGRNSFVPQGGGVAATDHRCPGEDPTIGLIAQAVRLLTRTMTYSTPEQDLRVSLRHLPAQPSSGYRITGVRAAR